MTKDDIFSKQSSLSKVEDPPEIKFERPKMSWQIPSQSHYQNIGIGLSLSYFLIFSPLSGIMIGWLIEQRYEDSNAIVWGLCVGAALGFIMTLLTLIKNK